MLDYFNEQFAAAKGRVRDPSFISIRRSVIKNHKRIRNRYLTSNAFVKNDHLLMRLLTMLSKTMSVTSSSLMDYQITRQARSLAQSLGVTAEDNYGDIFTDNFLNGGMESVMFIYDDYPKSDWRELDPVRFVYHTNTNFNFEIGTSDDTDAMALITVNVPMLVHQFLQWHYESKKANTTQDPRAFIAKYPLFNSLKSYMDICQINRHYYRLKGLTIKESPKNSKYPTPDYDRRLSISNKTTLTLINNFETTMGGALYNTPVFFKDSGLDFIAPINDFKSRKTDWFKLAAKLPYLHYSMLTLQYGDSDIDQKYMSDIKMDVRKLINSRILSHVHKHMRVHIIDTYLEEILFLANDLA